MRWFLNKLIGWLSTRKPQISCAASIWAAGVRELSRRTLGGRRESGAFLIGSTESGAKEILEFVFYDDIDPHALDTGIVHFSGVHFPKLWDHCHKRGYSVVADVHVHPGSYGQSQSDQENPVMPRAGHIAIIIPHFARRGSLPGEIGIYEYLGNGRWSDRTRDGVRFFSIAERP